jgi:hypothetical protein
MPYQLLGVLLHTMVIYELSRVRTELLHFVVVPSVPPHPVQLDRQFPGHRYFRDLPSAPHGEVKELAAGQPDRGAQQGDRSDRAGRRSAPRRGD